MNYLQFHLLTHHHGLTFSEYFFCFLDLIIDGTVDFVRTLTEQFVSIYVCNSRVVESERRITRYCIVL